uniref:Uncharacterized protein n=1 Tax=Hyaloperonospora arabidopsidis (strain Emoy2) TaxID=559515 RepID=M4BJL8_HYAAE
MLSCQRWGSDERLQQRDVIANDIVDVKQVASFRRCRARVGHPSAVSLSSTDVGFRFSDQSTLIARTSTCCATNGIPSKQNRTRRSTSAQFLLGPLTCSNQGRAATRTLGATGFSAQEMARTLLQRPLSTDYCRCTCSRFEVGRVFCFNKS